MILVTALSVRLLLLLLLLQRQAERTFVGRKCGNVGLTVHARGTDDSKYWNCTAIPSKAAAQYFIIKRDSAP